MSSAGNIGRDDRRRGRQARRARRRQALGLEALEDRRVLSTIIWTNRGADNFGIYGADADRARQIVDQAIQQWAQTIVSFNYANVGTFGNAPQNAYRLTINAGDLGGGGRGEVVGSSIRADMQGKPFQATINLDDRGGNAANGWYFDTVLDAQGRNVFDHAEFTDLDGRFRAEDAGTTGRVDFYQVILHEIGHAVGISDDAVDNVPGNSLTIVGEDQNSPGESLRLFQGGTRNYTFTTNGGGHLYEGPADPNVPGIPIHTNDLMNAGRTTPSNRSIRYLISQTDTDLLRDAFGYSVTSPRESFLANLNRVTGLLTVVGSAGDDDGTSDLDDDISFTRFSLIGPANLLVQFVDDDQPTLGLRFPEDQVRQIVIDTGLGRDAIHLDNLSKSVPVRVAAGAGDDAISIGGVSRSLDGLTLEIDGGTGADTLNLLDTSGNVAEYAIFDSLLGKGNPGEFPSTLIGYRAIESLRLEGRDGGATYRLHNTSPSTSVSLVGGRGPDTFRVSPTDGDLDAIRATLSIDGGPSGGGDHLELNDANNPDSTIYGILGPQLLRGGLSVTQVGLESVSILGGRGSNLYGVESTLAGTPVTLTTGDGDDTFLITAPTGRLTDLNSKVTVLGGGGFDRMTIRDTADAAPASYSLNGSIVSRNGKVHVDQFGIDKLDFLGNNRGNTFGIEGATAAVSITGGNGDDTFRLAPLSQNLGAFLSEVKFIGGAGLDTVVADDRSNPVGAAFRLDRPALDRNGRAIADIASGVEELQVLAGRGGDTFQVERIAAGLKVTLNGNLGDDAFQVAPGGRDLGAIAGTLTANGGSGTDSLRADDRANPANASYLLATGKLTRTVGVTAVDIGNSSVEDLAILGGGRDDSLAFAGVPSQRSIRFDAGAGNDTLGAMADSNLYSVTATDAGTVSRPGVANVVSFASTENLRGGSFDDTFRFADGTRISGRVEGLGGSDTLDYSAYTTRVNIHLILGLATGTGSGGTVTISTIENAIGGSAGDSFVGDDSDNIFLGNGGDDSFTARGGDDIVVGGDGDDTIRDDGLPPAGVTERNLLIGGRGADTIRGNSFKEELVIGGSTAFDANLSALRSILAEWKSAAPIATRVAHLRGTLPGGLNGGSLLKFGGANATVFDDAIADIITAGTGLDWFFASAVDDTDREPGDFLN
jgi:hypothetical protein